MASQRSTNTMAEFLQRMLSEISMAKTLADADLEFLVALETGILQKLRQPVDALQGQTGALPEMEQGQAQALPGPEAMMGAMGGDPGGGMPQPTGAMGGASSLPPMPNPDELRRMMGR